MKTIDLRKLLYFLAAFVVLYGKCLANDRITFGYQTTDYPLSLLQSWNAAEISEYRGDFAAEYGDGGGRLVVMAFQKGTGNEWRVSGCLFGPSSILTRPRIRTFEDVQIKNGTLKAPAFSARFCQFIDPEEKKLIKGVLIDGLFYSHRR